MFSFRRPKSSLLGTVTRVDGVVMAHDDTVT